MKALGVLRLLVEVFLYSALQEEGKVLILLNIRFTLLYLYE